MENVNELAAVQGDTTNDAAQKLADNPKTPSALFNISFLEKVLLLLITALISGLLVPFTANNIQSVKAKNELILQSQSKLLEDVAYNLMSYETLALDVSWYRSSSKIADDAMYQKAYERYSERMADLLVHSRINIIKAKNLASEVISKKLNDFQMKIFQEQDMPINMLYRNHGSIGEWSAMHMVNERMLKEANNLISELTVDLKITRPDSR